MSHDGTLDLDVQPGKTWKEHNSYMVAKAYAKHLLARMADMAEVETTEDDDCKLSHLKWMCEQVANADQNADDIKWSVTKMHRWIGYVQGVLITRKYSSVQIERDEYRTVKQQVIDKGDLT